MIKILQKIKYDIKYSGYKNGYGFSGKKVKGLLETQIILCSILLVFIIIGLAK